MDSHIVKANHPIALRFQPGSARGVIFGLIRLGMSIAIYLNHQAGRGAIEIGYKFKEGRLPPDFVAQLSVTDSRPYFLFCQSQRMTHIAGTLKDGRIKAVAILWKHRLQPASRTGLSPQGGGLG
jgi:hypothetical protein